MFIYCRRSLLCAFTLLSISFLLLEHWCKPIIFSFAFVFGFIKILLMQIVIELDVSGIIVAFHQWFHKLWLVLTYRTVLSVAVVNITFIGWLILSFALVSCKFKVSNSRVLFKASDFLVKQLQILWVIFVTGMLLVQGVRSCVLLAGGVSNEE